MRLVLLDALVRFLTLLGQLHSGHRHGGRVVAGTVSGGEGEDKQWVTYKFLQQPDVQVKFLENVLSQSLVLKFPHPILVSWTLMMFQNSKLF